MGGPADWETSTKKWGSRNSTTRVPSHSSPSSVRRLSPHENQMRSGPLHHFAGNWNGETVTLPPWGWPHLLQEKRLPYRSSVERGRRLLAEWRTPHLLLVKPPAKEVPVGFKPKPPETSGSPVSLRRRRTETLRTAPLVCADTWGAALISPSKWTVECNRGGDLLHCCSGWRKG